MLKNKSQARPGNTNARRGTDNRVILHCRIDPTTALTIKAEAARLNISQGELIDLWATATRAGQPARSEE